MMETLTIVSPAAIVQADFELREIIDGITTMSPSPFFPHQRIISKLFYRFSNYLEDNNLGIILSSPMDVVLEAGAQVVQPDLLVVLNKNAHILQNYVMGPPDLVVEVVSPSSLHRDGVEKRNLYQRFQIPEYWLVIPEVQTIEVLTLQGGQYVCSSMAAMQGSVHSAVLPGLTIDTTQLWRSLPPPVQS